MRSGSILVLSGVPGSGKTAVARSLRESFAIPAVSADTVRHQLFATPNYGVDESRAVYTECIARLQAVGAATPVLFDATNMRSPGADDWLAAFRSWAADEGVPLVFVHLEADVQTLRNRLDGRCHQRMEDDFSAADERTLELFEGKVPPGGAIRVDTTAFSPDQVAAMLAPLLDGRVPVDEAAEHIALHFALDRAASELEDGVLSGASDALVDSLLLQLDEDAAPEVLGRWDESVLIDSGAGMPILPPAVAGMLAARANIEWDWPVMHAGIAHTYGYLLSRTWTPYGWKRDRWVNGDVATALGVDRHLLSPNPPTGTLLSNLTKALDVVTGRSGSESCEVCGIRMRDFSVERINEEIGPGLSLITHVARRRRATVQVPEPFLLAYSVRRGDGERYVTAFSVSESFHRSLMDDVRVSDLIRARFNVAVDLDPNTRGRRWIEAFL